MSDTDLFGGDKPTNVPDPNKPQGDNFVSELVGEGKKFKTFADLERGKIEADAFIEQLKKEKQEVLDLAKAQEELLKKLKPSGGEGTGKPDTPAAPVDLDEAVARVLEKKTQEQTRKTNLDSAINVLKDKHGGDLEKVKSAIAAAAAEMGIEARALQGLAETSPKAFLRALGVSEQESAKVPAPSKPGSAIPRSTTSGVKNNSYYSNLRKELGARFWDANIQKEIFKARQELGDKFYQ